MSRTKSSRFNLLYYRKSQNAKNRSIEFRLSKDDIRSLLDEAGITEYDVGQKSEEYCLSRVSDTGAYEMGNCKYITNEQNRKEQSLNGKRKGAKGKKLTISKAEHAERTRKSWETRRAKYGESGRRG